MEENKKGGKGNHEEFMLELKKFRIEKGSLTTVYCLNFWCKTVVNNAPIYTMFTWIK
jgi:hypothetical protein